MNPLISIVLPVYNGEKYIGASIDSLLKQTYAPIEIVVVNDGSKDQTEQVVANYGSKVRYFAQSNRGQPAATNFGLSVANGSYVAFIDADDLYLPDKTASQVDFLEKQPEIDFVFGYVEQFYSPELSLEERKKWVCPSGIVPGYLASAGLFRKECFNRVGLFNEMQRIGVFVEWYMRASEKELKQALIPDLVLQRRIHGNNMGIHSQHCRLEYVQIVKSAIKRRANAEQLAK
jgi:glycosyltransferase involved in cell wall biosynthesis